MGDKNFYASFFFNESFTLNEVKELEKFGGIAKKISLPTAALKEDTNMSCSEFGGGFDLWSFDFDYTGKLF